jgi:lysophospholipid hydrolase
MNAEVGSGGTLSSLFTILSLFTEDVHISWHDGEREISGPSKALVPVLKSRPILARMNSDVSQFDLNLDRRDSESIVHDDGASSPETIRSPRAIDSSFTRSSRSSQSSGGRTGTSPTTQEQGTVARAVEDSTLAVIPAEAFRRLTKKFPKATAHIVQG